MAIQQATASGAATSLGSANALIAEGIGTLVDWSAWKGGPDPLRSRIHSSSSPTDAVGSWTRASLSALRPRAYPVGADRSTKLWNDAAFAVVGTKVQGTGAGEQHYVDNVQMERGAAPTAYDYPRTLKISVKPDRANLLANPSFEVDTTHWTPAASGATVSRDTGQHWIGAASLHYVAAGALNEGVEYDRADIGNPGQPYIFSIYVRNDQAAPVTATPYIVWRSLSPIASGIGAPDVVVHGQPVAVSNAGWTRLSLVSIAPNTPSAQAYAAKVGVGWFTTAPPAASNWWLDAALFEKGDQLLPYFDGANSPNGVAADAMWETGGTAHLSRSYYYRQYAAKRTRLNQMLVGTDTTPTYLPLYLLGYQLAFATRPW